MDRTRASLALLLLVATCGARLGTAASPRALLQGRSGSPPKGQPEDVAAIAGQLTGPNVGKFLLPGAASEFAKDSFIVQTEGATPEVVQAIMESVRGRALKVTDLNGPVFQGFALQLPPGLAQQSALLQELIDSAAVTVVEADMIVTAVQTVQNGATWGLDRIDQRDLPLSSTYSYTGTASDVTAYIIDTGILTTHTQFGGRASWGANFADNRNTDCNGHGTHCAGTVGGATYGIAKAVRLVAVKVLNCQGSGTNTGVISGMNWAVTNCASTPSKKCVASMSLGGGASATIDSAVAGATNAGMVMVVAAGNENQPACNVSPARAPSAVTVGATTRTDTRASFSNFGTCVDIFAPGLDITSSWVGKSNTVINTISGTSMATPHVSGVVALELSKLAVAPANAADVAAVVTTLINKATANKVTGEGTGSPNLLLYSA